MNRKLSADISHDIIAKCFDDNKYQLNEKCSKASKTKISGNVFWILVFKSFAQPLDIQIGKCRGTRVIMTGSVLKTSFVRSSFCTHQFKELILIIAMIKITDFYWYYWLDLILFQKPIDKPLPFSNSAEALHQSFFGAGYAELCTYNRSLWCLESNWSIVVNLSC